MEKKSLMGGSADLSLGRFSRYYSVCVRWVGSFQSLGWYYVMFEFYYYVYSYMCNLSDVVYEWVGVGKGVYESTSASSSEGR